MAYAPTQGTPAAEATLNCYTERMLNRLKIENFKAWRKADLTFGKVTGFFGANSAGKK